MKQGKCIKCKVAYRWIKDIHSRYCNCPKCGEKLQATLYFQTKFPWIDQEPRQLRRN